MKSRLRILHLEDNPNDAELIQAVLETEGILCHVTRVETQAEFFASLEQGGFDIILADYTLPSFDGLSALKIALEKCPDVPFIFVSGTLGEEVAIEALKIGATDYVFKERLSRIVPSVHRALGESKERTERKRAEEALRRSEAYLAEAQRLSHTGSFGWDVSSGEIYWSQETFRIFEYDPATQATIELVHQRTHPEDRALVRQVIDRVSQDRKDFDFEHRLLMPDGSVKYVRVVGHPSTEDESGNFEFVGAVTDITERKRAEEAVRAAKARFEGILEIAQDAIISVDYNQRIILFNQGAEKVFGYMQAEVIGRPLDLLLPQRFEDVHRKYIEEFARSPDVARTMGQRREVSGRRKGGGEFPAEASISKLDLGGELVFTVILRDITERQRAEEQLQQSQAYLHEAQRLGHMGSWAHNVSSGTFFASPEMLRIFGRDPDEEKPTQKMIRESIHPEDRPFVEEVVDRHRKEKTDFEIDHRIVVPDGSIRHVHSVGHPVLDDSGDLVEYIGTIVDVTDRKLAEETLRETQVELAHVTRVATLGEMTASIAHEINQPLAAVVNNASACLRWLGAHNLEEARRSTALIIADGHRAGEIISGIRALANKASPQKDWVNINETISEVIALARSEVQGNRVALQTQLSDELPLILGDRIQLQQVILNLINNAIEAMSGVEEGPRELLIRSGTDESQGVRVAVRDSGPGLDPQSLDRLFNAFYTTKPKGMGMGLAISRSIVEAHGGRLWASPNDGPGATFQFTLQACSKGE